MQPSPSCRTTAVEGRSRGRHQSLRGAPLVSRIFRFVPLAGAPCRLCSTTPCFANPGDLPSPQSPNFELQRHPSLTERTFPLLFTHSLPSSLVFLSKQPPVPATT